MNVRRKQCRNGERCQPASFAEAAHCLIEHSELAVKDLVGRLSSDYGIHVTPGYLYESANPFRQDDRGGYMQARLIIPLAQITGNHVLIDYMERQLGRVAVPLPRMDDTAGRETFEAGCAAVREFSQALEQFTGALADGHVTREELERLKHEAHESVQATLRLVSIAEQHAARESAPRTVSINTARVG